MLLILTRYWYLCFSTNKCKDFIKDINCDFFDFFLEIRVSDYCLTQNEHFSAIVWREQVKFYEMMMKSALY
jgi:hypothetical protein